MKKSVLLNLGSGSVQKGFEDINVQIWNENSSMATHQYHSKLPSKLELVNCYQRWKETYRYSWPQQQLRMEIIDDGLAQYSDKDLPGNCQGWLIKMRTPPKY